MKQLNFLVAKKELLTIVFVSSLLLSYGGIYLFVDEQFEATATIIPREEDDFAGVSSLLRGMKGLPLGLNSASSGGETDLYTTILDSRTLLEKVVRRFDLLSTYDIDTTAFGYMEKAIKRLRKDVSTKETPESAFLVSVRARTRERAAEMTNYIVQEMNDIIISLKVSRSRENRIFLENRVKEIRDQLKAAEDSMQLFQEQTGMFEAEEQVKGILTIHAEFEAELAARELQKGILERQYDASSPQVREVEMQIAGYKKKLAEMRTENTPGGILIGLDDLPNAAVEYFRRFREIEIDHLLLEFIIPLYEQAKIEEKKDYPVLQIIDHAIPPEKRSWPPRTLLSGLSALSVTLLVYLTLFLGYQARNVDDPELKRLLQDATTWSWRSRQGS